MKKKYNYNKSISLLIKRKVLKGKELNYVTNRIGYGLVKGKPLRIEE